MKRKSQSQSPQPLAKHEAPDGPFPISPPGGDLRPEEQRPPGPSGGSSRWNHTPTCMQPRVPGCQPGSLRPKANAACLGPRRCLQPSAASCVPFRVRLPFRALRLAYRGRRGVACSATGTRCVLPEGQRTPALARPKTPVTPKPKHRGPAGGGRPPGGPTPGVCGAELL